MRLIDADETFEKLDNAFNEGVIDYFDDVLGIVEEQPTAYDVDKVVEQLEELMLPDEYQYVIRMITKIVRAGGKE